MPNGRVISITEAQELEKRKVGTFTPQEARFLGIELQPDWTLRIEPGTNGDVPRQVFISPDKWEFSDIVRGEQGEVQDFRAISPEGQTFTKVELEEFEAQPTEVTPTPVRDVDLLYAEYQRTGGTLSFLDWQLAGTPIRPEAEVSFTEALQTVFPERLEPEAPIGITEIEQIRVLATENPAQFISDLVSRGRTPEVELLINTYFDVQPGDIDRLFEQLPDAEARPFREALPLLVTERNREVMVNYFFENPDALRRALIGVGRNPGTEALVSLLYPLITDKGMGDFFSPRVPGTVEGIDSAALGALPTKTWLDKVQEIKDDPVQLVPFLASGAEIIELGKLMLIAKKLEDGKEVSREDLLTLKAYVDRATMDTTWGFEVADVIAQIVPFAGEFIATGGIFTAGKTAAVKAGEQALKRIATRTGLRILEGRLAKFGLEVTGVVVGGTLRAPVAGVTRIPAATLEKQLQATLTGDEEAVWESALKALGEQWVEVVSESTGGLFKPLGTAIKGQLIKTGLFKAFIKANPAAKPSDIRRLIEKMGYNGVLGEMLEERVGDVGHGILEPLGLSDQKFSIPSVRQLTVELVAFSVPGGAALAIQSTPALFEKLSPKVKEALAEAIEFAKEQPEAGFVRIPGEKPEEITPEPVVTPEVTGNIKTLAEMDATPAIHEAFPELDSLITKRNSLIDRLAQLEAQAEGRPSFQKRLDKLFNEREQAETDLVILQNKITNERPDLGLRIQPPVTPEEVARPEPGAPEAGIQPSLIEGIPAEEVRPKGKGKILQISMEDQLKLQQAREAAEVAPDETREAYEAQAEAEGLKATHQADPVAQKRISIGKDKRGREQFRGLDFFISIREGNFPDYFTLKQARQLFPGHEFTEYTQSGTPQFNKVPRDVALDQLSKEFGLSPDEIADRVMAIRRENQRIKELQGAIKTQMTETPLPAVPELTTEEVTGNWETVSQPKLTLKQAQALSNIMGDYILSEGALSAYETQRALWSRTRTGQSEEFKARMQELQVTEGLGVEEAFKQASSETLAGKLPVVSTAFFQGMSAEMRSSFFTVAYHNKQLQEYPYEMASTLTALTNALDGKPIPRKKGTGSVLFPEGGSAWDRINFVFGKQPKVLKAIEKMAEEKKTVEDMVEGVFHETGREPIPIDQQTADYLRKLNDIPQGYKTIFEPDYEQPLMDDLRDPAELQFAQAELELGRQFAEGKLTFDEFQLKRTEARDEAFPLPPVTKYDAPIDKAFKIPPMFNFMEQGLFNRVLKEILWSPIDIGNFLRANKASFDNSFLRQSKLLLSGHPVLAWQAHTAAWQSMFSQKHTEAEWELITRDPDFHIYEQIRADTGHDPLRVPAFAATKGTEQYRTSEEFGFTRQDVERAIPRFTAWLPHVKYSERAFSAGTNKAAWGVWKQKLAFARRYSEKIASGDVVLKEGEAFDIIQEMTEEQSMLGDLIQRANLRRFSGLAPAMNAFFFAARSKVGRFLLPKHLLGISVRNKKVGFNPRVMKEAWKDFVLMNAYWGGLMFLGDWLDLWDTETDPRNAEVMSARIGKTRIDPWAGYRQFVVLYARLVTKTGVSSVTGAEYDLDPVSTTQSFFRNSLAPFASILLEFWTGRNFLGQVIDYDDAKYWIEKITPFAINDVWEAFEGEGWKGAALATIPAVYGEGVQTYTGDWEDNWLKLGLPKYIENTGVGLDEPYYDTADFWKDTASQFKGVDPDTLTAAKGFPPQIKAIAEANIINETKNELPNQKLIELNGAPSQGATFSDYHNLWVDRQKLVAAGDDAEWTVSELQPDGTHKQTTFKGEEAVEAFDKDETPQANRNGAIPKNAEKGNFSQRQSSLLTQYWAITDERKRAEFLEEHETEIGVNPRHDWLRRHPKENAELAIWGQAKVLTREAYDHFKTLAKKYDIPDNAVPELLLPPETSIDTHFDYEAMVSEGTHSSNEAKLLLLKDHQDAQEAGVKSYVDWRNESNQPLQLPKEQLEYYQLQVDNSQNYDDLEEAQEADDEEAVEAIRARKVDGETFRDVEWRIKAMGFGTREVPIDPEMVDAWVERGKVVDEFTAGSSEAKVWLLDNPEVHKWALDNGILTDDGSDWNEDALRLHVELSGLEEGAEQQAVVKRKIQAHSEGFTQIDDFVSYYDIPVKGFRQARYLAEHPGFAEEMKAIKGIEPPEYIPPEEYDDILEKEVRTPEEEHILKGYDKGVKEDQIDNYVSYNSLEKPLGQDEWYEDDWFLMENPEFYEQVYKGILGNEKRNFSKVPSRAVFDKYLQYLQIDSRQQTQRENFRWDNLDLDDWLLLTAKTTMSITEKRRRAAQTPGERLGESIAEIERRLREHP